MVKALVVVGKITMPRPGSQKAAQGCPGEGQLWGKGVQWEGQVPVRWWCMLCPVSRKAAVQSLFKEASGPSKTDWGRGGYEDSLDVWPPGWPVGQPSHCL